MHYNFKNLVFEGEGVRGLAYAGALFSLDERGILSGIKRCAGTSTGALTAMMVCLGYSPEEIISTMFETDFAALRDRSRRREQDILRLVTRYGWYSGKRLHDWIRTLVEKKTGNRNITFAELKLSRKFRDLFVIGANLSTHFAEVYSFEHTPMFRVADAVRISVSLPFLFASRHNASGDIMVDGGLLDNYPVRIFDRKRYIRDGFKLTRYYEDFNEGLRQRGEKTELEWVHNNETLGFRVDTRDEIAAFRDGIAPVANKITNIVDFSWHMILSMLNTQNQRHLNSDDWQRTVYISTCGINAFNFRITDNEKARLVKSGLEYTEKYFEWYDSAMAESEEQ
ncbi:MAG: patatin-like phospholipase family protein [Candidatus Wallbacteria bacterium]|nr:patatin-like phospholipase family protein [Candidatus Wallbacteria bacterium]